MSTSTVIRTLADVPALDEETRRELAPVMRVFEFRVSRYYLDLIDWSNPSDPLRQIVLPDRRELDSTLEIDPSDEESNTHVHGLQHKYPPTALLLVNDVCSSYCRFCFRKRFTLATSRVDHIRGPGAEAVNEKETTFDIRLGLEYIRAHPEIDNVLVTGGDPLTLSVGRLEAIIRQLRSIPHVRTIRLGTKVPAFDPENVTDELLAMLRSYCSPETRIYMMVHFNHQRELTSLACARLEAILAHGLPACNQTPLLRGVNDNAVELSALHRRLADIGVAPYYVFQCRPTSGNERFIVSLQEGLDIVNGAKARLSGLAKRFRYVGSHATGKIEIAGVLGDQLVMRYHEAKSPQDENRIFTWPLDRPVFWFDDVLGQSTARAAGRSRAVHLRHQHNEPVAGGLGAAPGCAE